MQFVHPLLLALSTVLPPHSLALQGTPAAGHELRPLIKGAAVGNAAPGQMRLTRIRLDTNTHHSVLIPVQGNASGQIRVPAAVSPDDFTAAVPVTTASGVQVLVVRDIRAPKISQSPRYWIPVKDPAATQSTCRVMGAPRFRGNDELWVVERPGNNASYRLARYQLGATSATFLGAGDMLNSTPATAEIELNWLVHADQAVLLQQTGAKGVELARYGESGSLLSTPQSIDPAGYVAYHAAFQGIRAVPGHPTWGFMQYGQDANGTSHARIIDLDTGAMTAALPVREIPGRISGDGHLALFHWLDPNLIDNSTLQPVVLPQSIVNGHALTTLPTVPNFFCGTSSDSIAASEGYIVTTQGGCQNLVHRTNLGPDGALQIVSIPSNTGAGIFQFYIGFPWLPRCFYDSTHDRVYNDLGLNLHVETMTYGPQTMLFPTSEIFF